MRNNTIRKKLEQIRESEKRNNDKYLEMVTVEMLNRRMRERLEHFKAMRVPAKLAPKLAEIISGYENDITNGI